MYIQGFLNLLKQAQVYTKMFPISIRKYASLVFSLLIGLTLLISGCSATAGVTSGKAANQTFIYPNPGANNALPNWTAFPNSGNGLNLDPAYAYTEYSVIVLNMIQTQLLTFNSSLQIIPDAAQSWQNTNGGKTWTFTLRPNLKWSDGTSLTSKDFVFSFEHELSPNLCTSGGDYNSPIPANRSSCAGGQFQYMFLQYIQGVQAYSTGAASSISGIQAPDNQTLVFTLTQPIAFFPYDMATVAAEPIEQSVYQKYYSAQSSASTYSEHYDQGLAQSGPFEVSAWTDNSGNPVQPQSATQIIFKPNPNWMGANTGNAVNLQKVVMPLTANTDLPYTWYQNNQVQEATVPPSEYQTASAFTDFHSVNNLQIDYIGLNKFVAPFNSLAVRQAFDLAINKKYLVDQVFGGAVAPTNHFIPFGIPGYNTQLLNPPDSTASASISGNFEKAQALIGLAATQCLQDTAQSMCPYIIGNNFVSTRKNACGYTYGVDAQGNSTQQAITFYGPSDSPELSQFVQESAAMLSNVLCLNVKSDITTHNFNDIVSIILQFTNTTQTTIGSQSALGIWCFGGYIADYPDPQDFTSNQFLPGSGNNASNVGIGNTDTALVSEMKAADSQLNQTLRYQMYANIEQQLTDLVPWIPFGQPKGIYRLSPSVKNFYQPGDGFMSDQDWPQVYISA